VSARWCTRADRSEHVLLGVAGRVELCMGSAMVRRGWPEECSVGAAGGARREWPLDAHADVNFVMRTAITVVRGSRAHACRRPAYELPMRSDPPTVTVEDSLIETRSRDRGQRGATHGA